MNLTLVADPDQMSFLVFAKHFSFRHQDSLGGLRELPEDMSEYVELCYRNFHRTLHRIRPDLEHEHSHNR